MQGSKKRVIRNAAIGAATGAAVTAAGSYAMNPEADNGSLPVLCIAGAVAGAVAGSIYSFWNTPATIKKLEDNTILDKVARYDSDVDEEEYLRGIEADWDQFSLGM